MHEKIILVLVGLLMLGWSVILPVMGILYALEHFGPFSTPAATGDHSWVKITRDGHSGPFWK